MISSDGENLMYYNTSVRGYPFGIQMGTDHRHLCLEINKDFSCLSYRKIPYRLDGVQVWGCGSSQLRYATINLYYDYCLFLHINSPLFIRFF
jgi:hypothetical protein